MNKVFSDILNTHEAQDFKVTQSEQDMLTAIRKEFVNAEEIISAAQKLSWTGKRFFGSERGLTDFPLIPVRKACGFDIRKHTQSQRPYMHGHDFYEVIYVRSGKCVQRIAGSPDLVLTEKRLCILPPETVHKLERCTARDIILKMVIPRETFTETFGRRLDEIRVLSVPASAEYFVFRLMRETRARDGFTEAAIKSCLTLFFCELMRTRSDTETREKLNGYFENNLKTASLAEFALRENYSAGYASRLIKNKTGRSFSEALNLYRIETAAKLLSETEYPIDRIACEIGYANASGFYKQFTAFYGMTPAEYRKAFR